MNLATAVSAALFVALCLLPARAKTLVGVHAPAPGERLPRSSLFGLLHTDRFPGAAGVAVTLIDLPVYAAALTAFSVLPCWWFGHTLGDQRRRRDVAAGLCPACRYDLRATPDRCPECGAGPAVAVKE
jgi:hypothetical protein